MEMAVAELGQKCWMNKEVHVVIDGDLKKLKVLLKNEKNVDAIPCIPESYTLLHISVGLNHADIVKFLLKKGADPNRRSNSGLTPLHISVAWDYPEILKLLLEHGGDPLLLDDSGCNSFHIAAENDAQRCLRILQRYQNTNSNENFTGNDKITEKTLKCQKDDYDQLATAVTKISLDTNENDCIKKEDNDSFSATDVYNLSDCEIRKQLFILGDNPGPIVDSTRNLYIKKLIRLKKSQKNDIQLPGYPPEIALILEEKLNILQLIWLEKEICIHFEEQIPKQKWRGGNQKTSFLYLLLDSRITKDLPSRAPYLSFREIFQTFVLSVFYVGKGTQSRPYNHLNDALKCHSTAHSKVTAKIQQILDIWSSGHGVVSLHCFHNIISVEAFTKEACILDSLGLPNLTNEKRGNYYGLVETWSSEEKRKFGAYLLYRAMSIFLNEGEKELFPNDLCT